MQNLTLHGQQRRRYLCNRFHTLRTVSDLFTLFSFWFFFHVIEPNTEKQTSSCSCSQKLPSCFLEHMVETLERIREERTQRWHLLAWINTSPYINVSDLLAPLTLTCLTLWWLKKFKAQFVGFVFVFFFCYKMECIKVLWRTTSKT